MSGFDERLFFEHDLATPFSNLTGAAYLLKLALGDPSPEAAEAMEILENNTHALQKMLHWYWELRGLEGPAGPPGPPWPLERLPQELAQCVRAHRLPLPAPAAGEGLRGLWTEVASQTLVLAITGAALTLRAASGSEPDWRVEGAGGVLHVSLAVAGEPGSLDTERLFRKLFWPPPEGSQGPVVDPGLPILSALLRRHHGGCELVWRDGRWTLEAWLPGIPA